MARKKQLLPPIHPGEILKSELLEPLGLSINKLARELRVPPGRIGDIVNGKRGISADSALRLGRYFGTSARFWLNLQSAYDLETAERETLGEIERDVRPRPRMAA
jgi:antitoxin HigA-1